MISRVGVLFAGGCIVAGGGGVTTRDSTQRVEQIGVASTVTFPQHVGPYASIAYRRTDGDGETVVQGGVRVQRYRKYRLAPSGPHARAGAQYAFDGHAAGFVAAGYHWDVFQLELEYAGSGVGNDLCVLVGLDIGNILAASAGPAGP